MWTEKKISERLQEIKKDAKEAGILALGQKELIAFCEGETLNPRKAILAHCYQCNGYYEGMVGERDCKNPVCPLYGFMPYSSRKIKTKTMTPEHKAKMSRKRQEISSTATQEHGTLA